MQIRIRINAGTDPDPQPRDRQRTHELLSGTTSIKDRYMGIQALILHFVLASILCSAVDPLHFYTDPRIRTNELRIRIRIWILVYSSVAEEMPTKKKLFAYYFLNAHLHQPSKTKSQK
jgi:hypothetical protein